MAVASDVLESPPGSPRARVATADSRTVGIVKVRSRSPAVPIAFAYAAGIAADRLWNISFGIALGCACVLMVVWAIAYWRQRDRWGAAALLGAIFCVGGAWHHLWWSPPPRSNIAEIADEETRPVRLIGRLQDEPFIVPKTQEAAHSAIPEYDRTICTVAAEWLVASDGQIATKGLVRLEVSGHLKNAHVRDKVDVVGQIQRPSEAQNLGGFDFRDYLRGEGIATVMRTEHPDAVRVIWTGPRLRPSRFCADLRRACELAIQKNLSQAAGPLGVAMLLGTRSAIPDDLRMAFAESGAMHILAISGINVGILAGFLWVCCRLLGTTRGATTAVMIGGVLAYALVTDLQPPVVRAALMISVLLIGRAINRKPAPGNLLAVALLIVLTWNPTDLFKIGPQLSFLAVMALIWSANGQWRREQDPEAALRRLMRQEQPAWRRGLGWVGDKILKLYRATAAVWLFTLPLLLATFHLITPVGFVLELLCMPLLVVFTLTSGYLLMIVGTLLPSAAWLVAWGFEFGLWLLRWAVEWGAKVPGGHLYLPGPAFWWLGGYYAILAIITFADDEGRARWLGWRGLLTWCVIGLAVGLMPRTRGELRCTFLAVGHGGAIVVESPGGEVLLYDAGSLQNAQQAQRTIQEALWSRGITRVDALVISHADVDHFNAVAGLLRTISVDRVLASPTFLDFAQTDVEDMCEKIAQSGVPIQLIWRGDVLSRQGHPIAHVLHPLPRTNFKNDNANSLVLEIEHAGRRILLTGDLEGEGLIDLLSRPRKQCDVILAPHHGSKRANPPELAGWAAPQWVVISGNHRDVAERLQGVYGDSAKVLSTAERGAVTVRISADGTLNVKTYRRDGGPDE